MKEDNMNEAFFIAVNDCKQIFMIQQESDLGKFLKDTT